MRKKKADVYNVIDILDNLHGHLEDCEFYNYDDAEDMELAKKEVLVLLEKMIERRMKNA